MLIICALLTLNDVDVKRAHFGDGDDEYCYRYI